MWWWREVRREEAAGGRGPSVDQGTGGGGREDDARKDHVCGRREQLVGIGSLLLLCVPEISSELQAWRQVSLLAELFHQPCFILFGDKALFMYTRLASNSPCSGSQTHSPAQPPEFYRKEHEF